MPPVIPFREELEREVLGEEFRNHLLTILAQELLEFDGPQDLLEFLHGPAADHKRKDAALRALLRAYQSPSPDQAKVGSLLLLALWPGLSVVGCSKRAEWKEEDEFWADLHWAFLETASQYPVARRPARVAQNLKLDTLNRLCAMQRDHCRHQSAVKVVLERARRKGPKAFCVPPDEPELFEPAPPAESDGDLIAALARACDRAVEAGLISDLDRLLVTATRVYGHELKAYAREHGLAYEMAKKRRQRAERVVRRLLEGGPRE